MMQGKVSFAMRIALIKLTILSLGLLSISAFAAEIPDAGRLLRESTPSPTLTPPQKAPEIKTAPEAEKSALPDRVRIQVSGFVYTGNTVFTNDELNRIMAPAAGRDLSLAELEQSVALITRAYRNKGYVLASALIPPQALEPGQPVTVRILEGRLEQVELKTEPSDTRVPRRLLEGYRDRVATGEPVNSDQLTETALLLNELPALQSRFLLTPGTEPGGTKAVLEVQESKPYSASLFADNYGNNSTGYYRVGAGLELYSPFRLGDRLSLRGHSSTQGDSGGAGIGWSVPVSTAGTRIALDYSWVRYELGRRFADLDAHGDAHRFSLALIQPLVRSNDLYLNAVLAGEGNLLDDRIDSSGQINKRHSVGGQVGLVLHATDTLLGGGRTSLDLFYTGGSLDFDNATARENDQGTSGLHTEGSYHKLNASVSRSQSLYGPFSLFASLRGQWSNKNLDSVEQISIGGPYGVRAYPVGEASADQGTIATAELRYLLPQLGTLPGRVQLAGLFDYGYAKISKSPVAGTTDNTRDLYGAGFEVNWQWDERVSLKACMAWRMSERPTSDDGDKPEVYVQAVARY